MRQRVAYTDNRHLNQPDVECYREDDGTYSYYISGELVTMTKAEVAAKLDQLEAQAMRRPIGTPFPVETSVYRTVYQFMLEENERNQQRTINRMMADPWGD